MKNVLLVVITALVSVGATYFAVKPSIKVLPSPKNYFSVTEIVKLDLEKKIQADLSKNTMSNKSIMVNNKSIQGNNGFVDIVKDLIKLDNMPILSAGISCLRPCECPNVGLCCCDKNHCSSSGLIAGPNQIVEFKITKGAQLIEPKKLPDGNTLYEYEGPVPIETMTVTIDGKSHYIDFALWKNN